MIAARLLDALTRIIVSRQTQGMDTAWWIEVDCEEDIEGERINSVNRAMADVREVTVAPWPVPIPTKAPVDASDRIDQMALHAGAWDILTGRSETGESARLVVDAVNPSPLAALSSTIARPVTGGLTPAETRESVAAGESAADAARWTRLPFRNEGLGGTDLGDPAWAIWETIPTGGGLALVVPHEQDHFAPLDLTHPERYFLSLEDPGRSDGLTPLSPPADPADQVLLEDGGAYVLYLRPRRWRWFVVVIAHFLYVDPFFEWENDEIFLAVFWDRPPFWPVRHDVTYTRRPENYNLYNYYGEPRSYDLGIESKWRNSAAAARMAAEIIAQQWWFVCNAYIFIGNEMPDILIESDTPLEREAVLGIGRVDAATGAECRLWVQQKVDLSWRYPRQAIGQFLANWYVTDY